MFARVKTAFDGKPDTEVLARQIAVGEVISGELAVVAVRSGWADEVPPNSKTDTAEADPASDRPGPPHGKRKRKET